MENYPYYQLWTRGIFKIDGMMVAAKDWIVKHSMKYLLLIVLTLGVACQQPADHKPAETNVAVLWNSVNYVLQSTSAELKNNNLKIYIERQFDSLSDYAIDISYSKKAFEVAVEQPWAIADSSYVPPRFKIVNQKIKLNKDDYRVGDTIQGNLFLLVAAHESYVRDEGEMTLRNNWDTLTISGTFSSMVK